VYDIAVPVKEGIYEIATVRLGLNKRHIDQLIGKLRTTFLGFVSVVTIIFFIVSHWLSRYITRPLSELTEISDELSRGNFEIRPTLFKSSRCWERTECGQRECPAFGDEEKPCWKHREAADGQNAWNGWNGSGSPCSDCGIFVESGGDEVRQLTESFVNMTNRIKQSQLQLRESEEKYRSLFTSGPNPIFVVDRNSLIILDANHSAEETYRYPRNDLIGMRFTELGPLDFQQGGAPRPGRTTTQLLTAKMQFFRRDRTPLYVNVHASPTRYQDRDAWIVATADISEMVEKDSQLIQASKMTTLGEMSAGIAHELNQPLNAIKMGSEFLKMMVETERDIPSPDVVEVVNEMSDQVDRAAQIIVRLRDFGRKADFTREKVNLNRAVGSVLDIVGKQLKLQNIDVRSELDERIPPILAHHNRLEQVIFNLITNARDAINQKPENGRGHGRRQIRIRSFTDNGWVAVSVSDTGIGISEGHKEQIFEAFFTTKQMGEGMGLGLAITTGIVGDYGGTIEVESLDGQGATFTLKFPSMV
jgi:PAS domain S-box-containing protein